MPCTEPTQDCIATLQSQAVSNAPVLAAIDERIELIEEKIAEATANNVRTVKFGIYEPVLTEWLKYQPATGDQPASGGFLNNFLGAVLNPANAVNQILSLIGIPLFRNTTRTNADAQNRAIAIADLSAKVATLRQARAESADKLRAAVSEELLAFDDARREYQAAAEIAKREVLRFQILAVEYRLGNSNTASFLANQSALDERKIDTYRGWSRVRGRLHRLKLLVLGTPDET